MPVWGYLSNFWDSVTESIATTTGSIIQYPVSFFQSIGNAVAGAVGDLFDTFFHSFSDIFIFLTWSFSVFGNILAHLAFPITFIYNFFKGVFFYAFTAPSAPDIPYTFSTTTISVLQAIPYWDSFATALGVILIMICGISVLKLLTHL